MVIHLRYAYEPYSSGFVIAQLLKASTGEEVERDIAYVTHRAVGKGRMLITHTWQGLEEGMCLVKVFYSDNREELQELLWESWVKPCVEGS